MAGLPPALAKQYGPFNGITWIGIIGGGVALAIVLRRSFGGATPEAKEPTATDSQKLNLPGTTYHTPETDGGNALQPTTPVTPAAPIKPDTAPVLPNVKPPVFGYPGPAKPTTPVPKIPTPTAPKTPTPTAPKAPSQDIPGGFSPGCDGVFSLPPDYPGPNVVAWIHASANPAQRSGKALGWAIGGQETPLTPGKLQRMKVAISSESSWPLINAQRRGRGLRPLSRQTFQALKNDIVNQAKTGRDAFPDTFIQHLWDTYYTPYICRNSPSGQLMRLT